jgi:hypothetical protein
MKKIIKPAEQEDCVYYSDFTGKCFGKFYPEVTLSIQFDYGSKYDGSSLQLHLSDEEADLILNFIKFNISEDFKKEIKEKLRKKNLDFDDAVDARDYTQCEYLSRSTDLLKRLTE